MASIHPGRNRKESERDRQIEIMHLTPRETEVMKLLLTRKSGPECAKELRIALGTWKVYSRWVFLKSGVSNRIELMAREIEK